jgi:acetyl-CoA carboxylase carboxyltransferase component
LVGQIAAQLHQAHTPKLALITRRGQPGGDFIAGGRELGLHFIAAWPDASVSLSEDSPYTDSLAEANTTDGPWQASGLGLVDDVLAPAETRKRLADMLALMATTRALPSPLDDHKGRVIYR